MKERWTLKCHLDDYSLELLYECQNMSALDEDTYSNDFSFFPQYITGWLWATASQTASVHGSFMYAIQMRM